MNVSLSASPAPRVTRSFQGTLLVLLLLVGLMFAELYHTRHEPLERDMPAYALIAHSMKQGRPLYQDIFDQKPPVLYLTYLAAETAFGYERNTMFLLVFLAACVTMTGVYKAGTALTRDYRFGLGTAALYAVFCADLRLEANQPNSEVFINACLVWAFALVVSAGKRTLKSWEVGLTGLLFALATGYKTIAIAVPVGVMSVYVLTAFSDAERRRGALRAAAGVLAVIALFWAAISAYFALIGHFDAYWYAMVTYNRSYAGSPLKNLVRMILPRHFAPPGSRYILCLPLIGIFGAAFGLRSPQRKEWLLLIAYLVSAYAAVALPGNFFHHYYQLMLPGFVIGAGAAFSVFNQPSALRFRKPAFAAFGAILLVLIAREASYYRLSAVQWSYEKYGTEFIEAEHIGRRVNLLLRPDELFFDASTSPEVYYAGKRPMVCGIFYSQATTTGPRAKQFAARMQADLLRQPPELILMEISPLGLDTDVETWIRQHYTLLPPRYQEGVLFSLWMRRGGALERRIQQGGVPAAFHNEAKGRLVQHG